MLKLGAVLDGKYKIISVIGQGGMSTVYLARHQRLNKDSGNGSIILGKTAM